MGMDHNKNEQLQEVIIGRCDNLSKLEESILNIDPITAGNLTGQTIPNEESINRELNVLRGILEKTTSLFTDLRKKIIFLHYLFEIWVV